MTDAELLRRYAEDRSDGAFAELVRRRITLVYSTALRQVGGDTHLAEDISQAVFTDLARQADSLCHHPALAGWLYTAARFSAAKRVRTEQRRRRREQEASLMQEINAGSAGEPDWNRLRPVLDEAMHKLKDRDRQMILLRYFDRSSLAEIGEELGVSANAAQKGVERALEKLRSLLARNGVISSATAIALVLAERTATAAPTGLAAAVTGKALAGAAMAGGVATSAFNLLQLMNATKLTTSIIGGTLLIAAVGTVHEVKTARNAEIALESAGRSYTAASERMHALERRGGSEEPHAFGAKGAQSIVSKAPPIKSAPARDEGAVAARALQAAHPEVNRAVINYSKAGAMARYLPLLSQLKLTPDQIAQFEQIMVDADPGGFGFGHVGYSYSFSVSDQPISQNEANARLQQLLGPSGFPAYQDYQRTISAASFANMVGQAAFDAGEPISVDQTAQLRQIVAANSAAYLAGGGVKLGEVDWAAVAQQSQGLLSEGQAASLNASVQQLQFNQAWSAEMKNAAH